MSESYPKGKNPLKHLLRTLENKRGQDEGIVWPVIDLNVKTSCETHYRIERMASYYSTPKLQYACLLLEAAATYAYRKEGIMVGDEEEEEDYRQCQEQVTYYRERLEAFRQLWKGSDFINLPDVRPKEEE